MSKTLKHHNRKQRRANKTQRLRNARRMTGGRDFVFNGNQRNTGELNALMIRPDHHVIAKHYSDTCTHCKNLEPVWDEVVKQLNPHPSFTVANLDPNATDYMNRRHYRKHNYGVNGFPTIVYIHKIKNVKPTEYQGERTAKAIIEWVTQILADNNLELSVQPKSQPSEPEFEEQPVSVPVSPVSELPVSELPVSELPVSEPPVSEPPMDQANAFPPAPLSESSSVLSNATQTVKNAAANVEQTISNGVDSIKSALTNEFDVGEKFGNLFSSSSTASVPAPASLDQPLVPGPVNVPSLVGGRRRYTRHKNRRSKSNKKSKKSKK